MWCYISGAAAGELGLGGRRPAGGSGAGWIGLEVTVEVAAVAVAVAVNAAVASIPYSDRQTGM